jgi:hypothetical protein
VSYTSTLLVDERRAQGASPSNNVDGKLARVDALAATVQLNLVVEIAHVANPKLAILVALFAG